MTPVLFIRFKPDITVCIFIQVLYAFALQHGRQQGGGNEFIGCRIVFIMPSRVATTIFPFTK